MNKEEIEVKEDYGRACLIKCISCQEEVIIGIDEARDVKCPNCGEIYKVKRDWGVYHE